MSRHVLRSATIPMLVLAAGMLSACGGDGTSAPAREAVASVSVQPDSLSVQIGASQQLTAVVRGATGNTLSNRVVEWSTSDAGRATVSPGGLVTATGAGRVHITASSEQKSASAVFIVQDGPRDFAIVGAQFTQGVQAADGSIAMVLSGNAAVVNVLVSASPPGATPVRVVLRLFDRATGTVVRTDTVSTRGTLDASPSFLAPSAQFLVPAAALRAGLDWQVARDSAANDVYPRTGRAQLATVEAPMLKLRFVPIVLTAHGNATGAVSAASIPEYMRTLLSINPIGAVDVRIAAPFATTASFGEPPSGGASTFWTQVLSELDLARIAHPQDADAHWYGVVRPPAGFNFTQYGGFAYIPFSGASTGLRTRTAVGVQVGWFNNPIQARDLVAHELGHNFGRSHAPCGGAAGPLDPAYPVAGGGLDQPGHDVRSWATGAATSALTIGTGTGDMMGYCFPVWASTYTYRGILNFRSAPVASPVASRRVLVVRGSIVDGRGVQLDPAFVFDARPSLPERPGACLLEGLSADGRRLFAYAFEPAVLDHAPDVRHFGLAIPATPGLEDTLHTLRVSGPAGEARLTSPAVEIATPTEPAVTARPAQVTALAGGLARVSCPDANARGIIVQDATSGAVLATANAASTVVASTAAPLTVACSDGVRSSRSSAVVY